MCGIFCMLLAGGDTDALENLAETLLTRTPVSNRGPDLTAATVTDIATSKWSIYLRGFVLHLRGSVMTSQPSLCSNGALLLWNGEIFDGVEIESTENDTAWLSAKLQTIHGDHEDGTTIRSLLSQIQGPWAFVYLDRRNSRLWFGRDILGRRCLLWKLPIFDSTNPATIESTRALILTSVAIRGVVLTELPTRGIYSMDMRNGQLTLHPWTTTPSGNETEIVGISDYPSKITTSKMTVESSIPYQLNMSGDLQDSLSSNIGDVFGTSVSRAREKYRDEFETVLSSAVRRRVVLQSSLCGRCIKEKLQSAVGRKGTVLFDDDDEERCRHARVAVLFSGGIDSMVIAALAHRHVKAGEPIDLLNVAFRLKPKPPNRTRKKDGDSASNRQDGIGDEYSVPDRVTGRAGWEELKVLFPERRWTFYNINITTDELREARENHIRHLVAPLQTVLDDSIGCAIWFAARGRGTVQSADGSFREETSTARVLLLGMGADEQLGGYTRHRTAFTSRGWEGLRDELRLDIDRISERNLGRDDRIVSDHGKEARFPFLDEQVVSFLNSLPCHYKMDLTLPRGYGEKFLLRHLAHKMELKSSTTLPKRAIQFGSRIAKMEDSKEKASDKCERLDGMKNS